MNDTQKALYKEKYLRAKRNGEKFFPDTLYKDLLLRGETQGGRIERWLTRESSRQLSEALNLELRGNISVGGSTDNCIGKLKQVVVRIPQSCLMVTLLRCRPALLRIRKVAAPGCERSLCRKT